MAERAQNLIPGLQAAVTEIQAYVIQISDPSISARTRNAMTIAAEEIELRVRSRIARERMPKPRKKGGAE